MKDRRKKKRKAVLEPTRPEFCAECKRVTTTPGGICAPCVLRLRAEEAERNNPPAPRTSPSPGKRHPRKHPAKGEAKGIGGVTRSIGSDPTTSEAAHDRKQYQSDLRSLRTGDNDSIADVLARRIFGGG